MNSGGGSTSTVEYPGYIQNIHSYILTGYGTDGTSLNIYNKIPTYNSALSAIERATNGIVDPNNPYSDTAVSGTKSAKDPLTQSDGLTRDDSLENIGLMLNQFEAVVDELDDSDNITSLVDQFEEDILDSHRRTLNSIASAYYDAGATNSSGFIVAMSLAESDRRKAVTRYRTELTVKNKYTIAELYMRVFTGQLDYTKYSLVAQQDKQETDIEYHVRNLMWDADQYRVIANMLGSPGGSVVGREDIKTNKMMSALGGAATGATLGYKAGGGNPVGIGIGALLGGVAGLVSS